MTAMATVTRVATFKLLDGHYLTRNLRGTYDRAGALRLTIEDAYRFWRAVRTRDHADRMHGMSIEVLPKRGRWRNTAEPLSAADAAALLESVRTSRLLAEADRQERMATGYLAQADHATKMAASLREKAAAIRADVATAMKVEK